MTNNEFEFEWELKICGPSGRSNGCTIYFPKSYNSDFFFLNDLSSDEEKEKHKRIHLSLKQYHESEYTMRKKSIWI